MGKFECILYLLLSINLCRINGCTAVTRYVYCAEHTINIYDICIIKLLEVINVSVFTGLITQQICS